MHRLSIDYAVKWAEANDNVFFTLIFRRLQKIDMKYSINLTSFILTV